MRVHLTGSRGFGESVLSAITRAGHTVTGVTAPAGDDVLGACARQLGLYSGPGIGPRTVAGAEVILAAHSHAFVGRRTRAAVDVAIGYHPSLLPLHRGRDAVKWTIRDRDRVAGGSVYHLTDAVDGGPLAAQDYVLVDPRDDARSLWRDKLAPLGVRLVLEVLRDLDAGHIAARPQDESLATWEPALDTAPLHRPELIEIASSSGAGPGALRWHGELRERARSA